MNSGTNLDSTYENQDRTVDEITQTLASTLEDIFDIKLQQKEKTLASHRDIGFLNFTRHHTRQDILRVQVHALHLGSPS